MAICRKIQGAEVPAPITTLAASTNLQGKIKFVWGNEAGGLPLPYYTLYKDGEGIATNIISPFEIDMYPGSSVYHVLANNGYGKSVSNAVDGTSLETPPPHTAPTGPYGFIASDDQKGKVVLNWKSDVDAIPTPKLRLFQDGEELTDWDLVIEPGMVVSNLNPRQYEFVLETYNSVGSVKETAVGIALRPDEVAPGPITLFTATDSQENQVTLVWSDVTGYPFPKYRLFRENTVTGIFDLLDSNADSGYVDTVTVGTYTYALEAYSILGTTTGTTTGTAIRPPASVLQMPQFTTTTSLTLWLLSQNVINSVPIEIYNDLNQPTLKFDGTSPTTDKITFFNSGEITGYDSGVNGIEADYSVTLINTGIISGAGGQGGRGGSGSMGADKDVTVLVPVTYPAGTKMFALMDAGFVQSSGTCNTGTGVWTEVWRYDPDGTTVTLTANSGTWSTVQVLGGAKLIMFGGSVCNGTGSEQGYTQLDEEYTASSTTTCTVPGGSGGLGGDGGAGASYINAAPLPGLSGEEGLTQTACGGTIGNKGTTGGFGGLGGDLGGQGRQGAMSSTGTTTSSEGQFAGKALVGKFAPDSLIGEINGGTIIT